LDVQETESSVAVGIRGQCHAHLLVDFELETRLDCW